ncbi:MAG: hypothetical protein RBR69_10245, partial [Candidatus Cloacimonadaceae bacterium]|nr:hypothetical protein [Candidatus Cloacimonadaceae bacterium]
TNLLDARRIKSSKLPFEVANHYWIVGVSPTGLCKSPSPHPSSTNLLDARRIKSSKLPFEVANLYWIVGVSPTGLCKSPSFPPKPSQSCLMRDASNPASSLFFTLRISDPLLDCRRLAYRALQKPFFSTQALTVLLDARRIKSSSSSISKSDHPIKSFSPCPR